MQNFREIKSISWFMNDELISRNISINKDSTISKSESRFFTTLIWRNISSYGSDFLFLPRTIWFTFYIRFSFAHYRRHLQQLFCFLSGCRLSLLQLIISHKNIFRSFDFLSSSGNSKDFFIIHSSQRLQWLLNLWVEEQLCHWIGRWCCRRHQSLYQHLELWSLLSQILQKSKRRKVFCVSLFDFLIALPISKFCSLFTNKA